MTLDLDELTAGWDCPCGELRARLVVGRDGAELLQLRVDLGVMQMFLEGRPDGTRYHGLPGVREYIAHELRVGPDRVTAEDWQELERELTQTNYRRVALATLAEEALQADASEEAARLLRGALRDAESALAGLELLAGHGADSEQLALRPTLVFDRARLRAQLRVIEGDFEAAIEEAERGADDLELLLAELGSDEEQRSQDPGVSYLRELGQQLRQQYGLSQTLREQLEAAIEQEDFEAAARLRDELRRRRDPGGPGAPDAPAAE